MLIVSALMGGGCTKHYARTLVDKSEHHVLCIGNSITTHEYLPEVGWLSEWGMAASIPENDYCHQLQRLMRTQNEATTVTPLNLADWEGDFSLSIDSMIGSHIADKDIAIIRLAENVQNVKEFEVALTKLVKYCKKHVSRVYLTGSFWEDADKEAIIAKVAVKNNVPYIPLYSINDLYKDEIYPHIGDTLYNIEGEPYKIEQNFILTHPNDKGMLRIAEKIYETVIYK